MSTSTQPVIPSDRPCHKGDGEVSGVHEVLREGVHAARDWLGHEAGVVVAVVGSVQRVVVQRTVQPVRRGLHLSNSQLKPEPFLLLKVPSTSRSEWPFVRLRSAQHSLTGSEPSLQPGYEGSGQPVQNETC